MNLLKITENQARGGKGQWPQHPRSTSSFHVDLKYTPSESVYTRRNLGKSSNLLPWRFSLQPVSPGPRFVTEARKGKTTRLVKKKASEMIKRRNSGQKWQPSARVSLMGCCCTHDYVNTCLNILWFKDTWILNIHFLSSTKPMQTYS